MMRRRTRARKQRVITHTLPGYLYLKRKGKLGKNGENAGKRHPRGVCAATFPDFLDLRVDQA